MPPREKNPRARKTSEKSPRQNQGGAAIRSEQRPAARGVDGGRSVTDSGEKVVVIRRRAPRSSPWPYVALGMFALLLLSVAVLLLVLLPDRTGTQSTTGPATESTVAKFPASWQLIGNIEGEMQTLVFDPADRKIAFLGTQGAGLLKSTDGASTFQPTSLKGDTVLDVSIDPQNRRVVWAAGMESAYVSRDGGATWRTIPGLPNAEAHAVQADPAQPSIVWAGFWMRGKPGPTLYRSGDGGSTWAAVSGGPQGADIDFVSFEAGAAGKASTAYVGTFGKGLFRTADGGKTWEALNNGLPTNTDITLLAWSPDKSVFYAGTHDFGVFRSLDRGASWQSVNKGKEEANDVHGIIVPSNQPNVVWVAGMMHGRGVFRSADRGETWQSVETGDVNLEDTHVFTLDAEKKGIILGAGEHGTGTGTLYRTAL